jgi:purine-nucleoside phosphorylase
VKYTTKHIRARSRVMELQPSRAEIQAAVDFISQKTTLRPLVGLILGSGLASLAAEVTQPVVIPYADIPRFAPATVEGHPGELVLGRLQGCPVMMMSGRAHYYEGYPMAQVTFPIRVMWAMGVTYLVVTNAAGALDPSFRPGDLMLITDHIGLVNMVGLNPLRGPNDPEIGPRFPDMSQAYDPELRQLALQVATELGITLHQGVYIMLSGPSFETPADLRFIRMIGADAVGMSTVPEVTVAHHAGIRVLGISGISNAAVMEPGAVTLSHEEVLAAGKSIVTRLSPLIKGILRRLEQNAGESASA